MYLYLKVTCRGAESSVLWEAAVPFDIRKTASSIPAFTDSIRAADAKCKNASLYDILFDMKTGKATSTYARKAIANALRYIDSHKSYTTSLLKCRKFLKELGMALVDAEIKGIKCDVVTVF